MTRDDRATPGASAPDPVARGAFEVAPASLARSGSHRGPLVIALAVVAMVAVAIAKPWAGDDAASGGPVASGPAASSGVAGGVPTPSAPSAPPVISYAEGDVFVAATPRSAWGIRAIVLPAGRESRPGGHALEDRWTAYDVDGGAADPAAPATAVGDGEAVIGLGVTTPPTVLPLDVRFWRIVPGGIPRRVVPQPIAGPDAGSWIWTPNPAEAAPNGAWPPGRYRVDVLTGPRVVELLAVVPGDETTGIGPSPGAPSPLAPADLAAELRPLADGLFVVTGSGAAAVEGLPGDLLDARQAWFEPGVDRPRAAVGRVASEGVEAIGVILPAGAWAPRLAVRQVSPGFAWVVTRIETVPLEPSGVGGGPTAVAAHGGSGPFAPGVYELTARWQTATARPRAAVWHLEIVPRTPPTPPGSPLEALARWTGRADIPGAADGEALVTRRDLRPSGDAGTCGPNGGVTSSTSLLGLALPRGETVTDIRLIAPDGYTQIETRAMLPGADGLALVATRSGGFIPGRYRLDVTRRTPTGTAGRSYDVCFREP